MVRGKSPSDFIFKVLPLDRRQDLLDLTSQETHFAIWEYDRREKSLSSEASSPTTRQSEPGVNFFRNKQRMI